MDKRPGKVLFIEPYYGGSHRRFADSVVRLSSHEVHLVTLPASFWKWRMRGAHLTLAGKIKKQLAAVDCILASDMLSLSELLGIVPEAATLPTIVYFHENQLGYPVSEGDSPDVHFGFTNISTALSATRLVFNSGFHRDTFFKDIPAFLSAMPDHRPRIPMEDLWRKSTVIYPGIDCDELDHIRKKAAPSRPFTIVWNHRWEFDKRPEVFFRILGNLAREGIDFKVHIIGENFRVKPAPFLEARQRLGARIGKFGYLPDRKDYIATLRDSDIVVSCAIQEFFGISVMEAAYCGCYPLVPSRLVYPELYDTEYIYRDEADLQSRLGNMLKEGLPRNGRLENLRALIRQTCDVKQSVRLLDDLFFGQIRYP